jgi:peptide methionine sulfoxide reductase MsrA
MKNITLAAAAFFFFSSMAPTAVTAETFTYSGGCFWCTEADTEKLDGVNEVISGFTGWYNCKPSI